MFWFSARRWQHRDTAGDMLKRVGSKIVLLFKSKRKHGNEKGKLDPDTARGMASLQQHKQSRKLHAETACTMWRGIRLHSLLPPDLADTLLPSPHLP